MPRMKVNNKPFADRIRNNSGVVYLLNDSLVRHVHETTTERKEFKQKKDEEERYLRDMSGPVTTYFIKVDKP